MDIIKTSSQRLNIISDLDIVNNYINKLTDDDPKLKIEKLIKNDSTNDELIISIISSKKDSEGDTVIRNEEDFMFRTGDFKSFYFGKPPENVEYFILGDINNPGYYSEYLFPNSIKDKLLNFIIQDLKKSYEDLEYLYIYYSKEYKLLAVNPIKDDKEIFYFDLNGNKIDFDLDTSWIKINIINL